MPSDLRVVVVNLSSVPRNGGIRQVIVRLQGEDKRELDAASNAIGYSQADFVRACIVNTAKEINKQLGIEKAPPPNV